MTQNQIYAKLVSEIRDRIQQSRYEATRLVNREQLKLYFAIGQMISRKIESEKWGEGILKTISADIQKLVPGIKGFSARNLRNMRQFFEAYRDFSIWQTLSAKLKTTAKTKGMLVDISDNQFFGLSFSHHLHILAKCKSIAERKFYIVQSSINRWSLAVLEHHISSSLFVKQGVLPNNFSDTLPDKFQQEATQLFRDEYLLNYLDVGSDLSERELENKIIQNIKMFILTMGKEFCFMGSQYRIEVDGYEFFVDLLFFNRNLQCLVAFLLKTGNFKPEFIGKINFYQHVLDSQVRLTHEKSTIGIVLCKEKNNTIVECAIKNVESPLGVATFRTTAKLPYDLSGVLPNPEELSKLLTSVTEFPQQIE